MEKKQKENNAKIFAQAQSNLQIYDYNNIDRNLLVNSNNKFLDKKRNRSNKKNESSGIIPYNISTIGIKLIPESYDEINKFDKIVNY